MPRGRPQKVSDDRLLLELLLHQDRAAYSGEIAERVAVGQQTVRDRLNKLADDGLVDKTELESHNVYRLTAHGREQIADLTRTLVDQAGSKAGESGDSDGV